MRHRILKSFKGSPDGRFVVEYTQGEEVHLTVELAAIACSEGWAEPIAETAQETTHPDPLPRLQKGKAAKRRQ